MSITSEVKQYTGVATEQGKAALAGVRKPVFAAVGAGDLLVSRTAARGKQIVARSQDLATARVTPATVSESVRSTVSGYLQAAGDQANNAYTQLSRRGAEVVHEFRKDPRVQRVILRTERAVDVVEDSLEDLLDEAGQDVAEATAAAKDAVSEGADKTRATVRKSAARNTNARKSTAKSAPARKAPVRDTAARKATPSKVSTGRTGTSKSNTRKTGTKAN